jgi:hypothetical protein
VSTGPAKATDAAVEQTSTLAANAASPPTIEVVGGQFGIADDQRPDPR